MRGTHTQAVAGIWPAVALVCAVATARPELFTLDLAQVAQGEWWRLMTGHLAHLSWRHYVLDLTALGLVLRLCRTTGMTGMTGMTGRRLATTALLSMVTASLVVLLFRPVEVYGGISAVTVGLMTAGALDLAMKGARLSGIALLLTLAAKIAAEAAGLSASAVTPVWQAHLAGVAAGAMTAGSS
jgi:rhomboid family GlyGly-CTERM serine protease